MAKVKRGKVVRYNKWGYIFLIPFVVVYVLFQLIPLFRTFYYSFFENYRSGLTQIGPNFIGFGNYAKLLSNPDLWMYTKNTLIMWVLGFVPQIIISLLFAYWFTNVRLHLRCLGLFKTVMYMPNLIMASAFAMLIFSIFSDIGPINELIKHTTGGEAFRFLSYTGSTMGLVAFMNFIMWFGNTTILLMAAMMGINESVIEAAEIDGASSSQIFWKITLPHLTPMILLGAIYTVVETSNYSELDINKKITGSMFDTTKLYSFSAAMSWIYFCAVIAVLLVVFLISVWLGRRSQR